MKVVFELPLASKNHHQIPLLENEHMMDGATTSLQCLPSNLRTKVNSRKWGKLCKVELHEEVYRRIENGVIHLTKKASQI